MVSAWAPAVGHTVHVRWVPRSKEKTEKKKSGQHGRGVSWRQRYTVPIDAQIRAQELHSQSLSPKKNWWCFSAKRVMSGKIALVATCILVCNRSVQTLQFSDCAICRHREQKVRPLPKFGEHRKSTPRSEQCAHLSSRVQVCHE